MNSINRVLSVDFAERDTGKSISADEVFDTGYSSLDSLIAHNLTKSGCEPRKEELHRQKSAQLFSDWAENVPEELVANLTTDAGVETYKVVYRTNMHPSAIKIPNIVYLKKDFGTRYIVRDARKHDASVVRTILRKHHNELSLADYTSGVFNPKSKMTLIPEPNLIVALQTLQDSGYPVLIPPQKVMGAKTGRMFLLRDFLGESVRDSTFDPQLTGEYLGNLHSYGLMEILDRQIMHYFIVPGNDGPQVVNIDPDVSLWSMKGGYHDSEDLRSFIAQIKEAHPMIPSRHLSDMKQVRAKVIRERRGDLLPAFIDALSQTYSEVKA